MKDEIKKILEKIKSVSDFDDYVDFVGTEFKPLLDYITNLQEENEHLKYHLNDIVFDDSNIDVELGARLLRKLGYCDFDDKKQVYVNKHNNQPFMQEDTKEKAFYIKDDKLDDYTKQLESDNENYKSRNEKAIEYIKDKVGTEIHDMMYVIDVSDVLDILQGSDKVD